MALQSLQEQKLPVQVFPVTETVAGFEGARIVTTMSGSTGTLQGSVGWASNATSHIVVGGLFFAGSDYNPDFVATIFQADAAAPEASFNNVVDMLDWLDRE